MRTKERAKKKSRENEKGKTALKDRKGYEKTRKDERERGNKPAYSLSKHCSEKRDETMNKKGEEGRTPQR